MIQENVQSNFTAKYYCNTQVFCQYCGKKIKCGQNVFGVDVKKVGRQNMADKIFCKEQCAMLWKLNGDKAKKHRK